MIKRAVALKPDRCRYQIFNAEYIGHDQWTGVESVPKDRIRRVGGGRQSITEIYPDIETALLGLVKESPHGDPESP